MADENGNLNPTPGSTGDGGGGGTWLDSLPEDLKGNEALKGYDGIESLAKAHLTAQGELAGLKQQIEDGKPVIPETPEAYELPAKFEGIPDEAAAEVAKSLSQVALEAGLTKEQAGKAYAAIMAQEVKAIKDEAEAIERKQAETKTSLQKEYGDKYAETMNTAFLRCAEIAGTTGVDGATFKAWLDNTGIGDDPTFIKFAVGLAKLVSSDGILQNAGPAGPRSAAEILYPNQGKS